MNDRGGILIFNIALLFLLNQVLCAYSQTTEIYPEKNQRGANLELPGENDVEKCIQKLYHIKSQRFLTSDCCFTKICPDVTFIASRHPQLRGLLMKLCSEQLHLREEANGCCGAGNHTIFSRTGDCKHQRGDTISEIKGKIEEGSLKMYVDKVILY